MQNGEYLSLQVPRLEPAKHFLIPDIYLGSPSNPYPTPSPVNALPSFKMKTFGTSIIALLVASSQLALAGKHFWSFCVITASPCLEGDQCTITEPIWAYTDTDNYDDWERSSRDRTSDLSGDGNAFRPVDTDDSCEGGDGAAINGPVCVKLRDNQLSAVPDGFSLGSCREVAELNGPNVSGEEGYRQGDCNVRLECN